MSVCKIRLLKIEKWVNMRNKQEIVLNGQVIWKKEPNQIYIDGKKNITF